MKKHAIGTRIFFIPEPAHWVRLGDFDRYFYSHPNDDLGGRQATIVKEAFTTVDGCYFVHVDGHNEGVSRIVYERCFCTLLQGATDEMELAVEEMLGCEGEDKPEWDRCWENLTYALNYYQQIKEEHDDVQKN